MSASGYPAKALRWHHAHGDQLHILYSICSQIANVSTTGVQTCSNYKDLNLPFILVITFTDDISFSVEFHVVALCGIHLDLSREFVLGVITAELCALHFLLMRGLITLQDNIAAGEVSEMEKPVFPFRR